MLHVPVGFFGSTTPLTRPTTTYGTSVTPVVGSKGSWAQIQSALAYDAYGILITIHANYASSASRNTVVDIGVDPAGGSSYVVRIPDLLGGGAVNITLGTGQAYFFPLFIPAGSTIGARAQGSVTTAIRVFPQLFYQAFNPSQVRKGSFVRSFGISAPGGTAVTPGTTSDGSWVQLGSATVERLWWWQVAFQVNTADTSWNSGSMTLELACGDASNKRTIIQDLLAFTNSGEYVFNPPLTAGVEFDVPAGTNIYVRAQHSGTLDAYNMAAWGLGG